MGDSDIIILTQSGRVACVTLNRPAQRNAMSRALVEALSRQLHELAQTPTLGAIVLAGAGSGFCAGSDISELARTTSAERSAFEAESGRLARLIGSLSLPVIAAVKKFAIGGGLTLATSCDIVVTEPAARWSLPEVPIGLFPAWGLASVIQRTGRPVARRLAWGIDTLDGVEAHRVGLADVLAEDAHAEAMRIAEQLAALPRQQSASVKEYFLTATEGESADLVANRMFMNATLTPEAAKTFNKYASKR